MPLQNRVTPFGTIIAVSARGMFMGNRGCLHDDQRRIARQFSSYQAWIVCLTEFKGRKRNLMAPGHYTELFFLDEATALAAGHRPCGECRRADYRRFKKAWLAGNPNAELGDKPPVKQIDKVLHAERLNCHGEKPTYRAAIRELPDATFVRVPDAADAFLLWRGKLHRWTPGGYDSVRHAETEQMVEVLMPRSIVQAVRAGYEPVVHATLE